MSHIANLDIPSYKGDTIRFFIDFFEDAAQTVPFDLSQFAAYTMDVRTESARQLIFTLILGDGLTILSSNRLEIEVSKARNDFNRGVYVYDIEGDNTAADRRTLIEGKYVQEQDVTKTP